MDCERHIYRNDTWGMTTKLLARREKRGHVRAIPTLVASVRFPNKAGI